MIDTRKTLRRKALQTLLACTLACPMTLATTSAAFAEEAPSSAATAEQTMAAQAETMDLAANGTASQSTKKGLVKEGDAYYYYQNGEALKDAWKKIDGHKYYFLESGKAAIGAKKIDGAYYIFDEKGRLVTSAKGKLVTVGKKLYCALADGKAANGWALVKGQLYHTNKKGEVDVKKTIDGIKLDKDGVAKDNARATCMKAALQRIAKVCKPDMTGMEKLKACWKSIVYKNYKSGARPNTKARDWMYTCAVDCLAGKKVNCYGYACAFAACAKALGYQPYLLDLGHAWVRINGKYWDTIDNRQNADSGRVAEKKGNAKKF